MAEQLVAAHDGVAGWYTLDKHDGRAETMRDGYPCQKGPGAIPAHCLGDDPTCPLPEALAPDLVETIVRWYVLNGGAPGSVLDHFGEQSSATSAPRDTRATIAVVLATCPHRLVVNPRKPERTITPIERAILAELEYEAAGRQLMLAGGAATRNVHGVRPGTGRETTTDVGQAWRELDTWHRVAERTRLHPLFDRCLRWLGCAFGAIVHGDPARGLHPDHSFLPYIVGE